MADRRVIASALTPAASSVIVLKDFGMRIRRGDKVEWEAGEAGDRLQVRQFRKSTLDIQRT
ncbi:hypothetical protein [Pyrobaculum islandicum]|uniref:hypothetical protein n=1 Tax=Pyrobaculum islandicum TaxID=2277 RepID=UPI0014331A97|nr:hypothetical protein [Pyrobaculum islandicum]